KMLQQAFAVALHSDYQVRVQENIPESSAVNNFDAVIVDAASLAERNAGSELRAVRGWKVPTVWIDKDDAPEIPTRDNLVIVKWPVHNDSLRKALTECLTPSKVSISKTPQSLARSAAANGSKAKGKEKSVAAASDERQFIELVDVVEAPTFPHQKKTAAKKK
ncbi:MAG TPA: hypothetical protein VK603_07975, partial [Candidatus Saccharimonadales bacterium]|nr:hypothetical protein [Candidatus Saccharimonadales bacterium]